MLTLVTFAPSVSADDRYDLLIQGGRVVDGSGDPSYIADVAITDGVISKIGKIPAAAAVRVIDAQGLIVAPGFVDMNSGEPSRIFSQDRKYCRSLLAQGITTIHRGCGESEYPHRNRDLVPNNGVTSMVSYFQRIEMQGVPINVVQSIAHTRLRKLFQNYGDRPLSAERLAKMQAVVRDAMENGAIGFSSDLTETPTSYAKTGELVALAEVAAEHGGRFFTRIRSDGNDFLEALDEALEVGVRSDASVHLLHFQTAGAENQAKLEQAIARIQAARSAGQLVTADVSPYRQRFIASLRFLPPQPADQYQLRVSEMQLDEPRVQELVRRKIETTSHWENWFRYAGKDWKNVLTTSALDGPYPSEVGGRSIATIATQQKEDPWTTFFALVRAGASLMPETMNEESKAQTLQLDFVSFCTGAGTMEASSIYSHPRGKGAFPYLYSHFVREKKILTIEQFVAQASSAAAKNLLLEDRGRIQEGLAADVIVFSPEEFRPKATFDDPLQNAEGMKYVVLNGQMAIDNGEYTDRFAGRLLRGPGYRPEVGPSGQVTGRSVPELTAIDQAMKAALDRYRIPGAAVAITDQGRLIYSRGFGYAELANCELVKPDSLFRIASVSKPITAAAILHLVDQGKLSLDDRVFDILDHEPFLQQDAKFDERQRKITIRQLLQHRGGWERTQLDPMFQVDSFARILGLQSAAKPDHIIRIMLGKPLDFEPGERYAYSNYGYCLLGRVIEQKAGQSYEQYVQQQILAPLGIEQMKIGSSIRKEHAAGEVYYYAPDLRMSVMANHRRQVVPAPYGAWDLRTLDAHGGWIASATDLARFACALDDSQASPLLSPQSLAELDARPEGLAGHDGSGDPKRTYYGGGWVIAVDADGKMTRDHAGSLPGTNSIVVRRSDSRNLVILMNSRRSPHASDPVVPISETLNAILDQVDQWPQHDLFPQK
ncbi:serine hydrolase [Blastopirellula sp. J2-11]|uniref:serine hydrolase n=1 Tax=Blastopirellula sp. J2-11 TaxID=2943192 RepID=UPI0021CAD48B|nr:serine hydrolase [Blastopirellula sp. J2-11]UUO09159.1 serine hydrolase [Blastopirellula sp. J2-11]